jgi:hypothetical protein
MSRPRQIAELIQDAVAMLPVPEDAAEAYEYTQALAGLPEAVARGFYGLGERTREHSNLKPEIPGALEDVGDGSAVIADHLRDLPRPRPEKRRKDREDEKPDWVQDQQDRASGYGLRHIDPRQVEMDVWRYQRGEQG